MWIFTALFTLGLLHASMGQPEGSGSFEGSGGFDSDHPIFPKSTAKPFTTTVFLSGSDDEDIDVYLLSSGEKECEGSGDCDKSGLVTVPLPTQKVVQEESTTSALPVVKANSNILGIGKEILDTIIEIGDGLDIDSLGGDNSVDIVIEEQPSTTNQLPTRSPPKKPTEPVYRVQTDSPISDKPDRMTDMQTVKYDLNVGNSGDRTVSRTEITVSPLIGHPGILAAVIGGGVVALLCAILLVMFIVYRMRKKDEGSYPLDEKPRHTAYTSVPSKEFYA